MRLFHRSPFLFALFTGLLLATPLLPAQENTPTKNPAEAPVGEVIDNEAKIKKLIEQLGAPEYALRQAAEHELELFGVESFDALEAAQNHGDLEISMRAQHLLKRFRVTAQENDPPAVKTLLRLYASKKNIEERVAPLSELARLPDRLGWAAIGRLARLEQDETLSKRAALAILTQPWPKEAEYPQVLAALPGPNATSKRRSVEWLKAYAATLREPDKMRDTWERLIDEEFALLTNEKARTTQEIVLLLTRWHVESLRRMKQENAAEKVIDRLAGLLDAAKDDQIEEHIDWLAHLGMWPQVVQAERRFAAKFAESGQLLYRLAEAKLKLGEVPLASELAEKAFKLSGNQLPQHVLAGQALAQKGLFEWAEREYREVLRAGSLGTNLDIQVRSVLSEMFHDQGEELKAVEVLKTLVEAVEKDNNVRQFLERSGREEGAIKSRMHYFLALDFLAKGNAKLAEENFRLSLEEDTENIDAMISLYRLSTQTAEARKKTLADLHELIQQSQKEIDVHKQELTDSDTPNEQTYYRIRLAKDYNNYAWLVSNTEGDFDSAIRSSHESLKLRPNTAAYMDTLGRTYFAKGDFPNAIKWQSEAIRLEPHSGLMKRQLEMIKSEAAKKQAS